MSCKYYESCPGYYGSCKAKKENARVEKGSAWQSESDGYIEYEEWKNYNCSSGDTSKCKNCPHRS